MNKTIFLLAMLLLGCASNSGVIPMGQDTYMVSRQAATGFSGMGTLKAEAIGEASRHCASLQKKLEVVSSSDSQPPYILGNFPRTELQFKCV